MRSMTGKRRERESGKVRKLYKKRAIFLRETEEEYYDVMRKFGRRYIRTFLKVNTKNSVGV